MAVMTAVSYSCVWEGSIYLFKNNTIHHFKKDVAASGIIWKTCRIRSGELGKIEER